MAGELSVKCKRKKRVIARYLAYAMGRGLCWNEGEGRGAVTKARNQEFEFGPVSVDFR